MSIKLSLEFVITIGNPKQFRSDPQVIVSNAEYFL